MRGQTCNTPANSSTRFPFQLRPPRQLSITSKSHCMEPHSKPLLFNSTSSKHRYPMHRGARCTQDLGLRYPTVWRAKCRLRASFRRTKLQVSSRDSNKNNPSLQRLRQAQANTAGAETPRILLPPQAKDSQRILKRRQQSNNSRSKWQGSAALPERQVALQSWSLKKSSLLKSEHSFAPSSMQRRQPF